ncbi:MAG: hypothetical protein Q8M65_05130, partial [Rhodoglobus sp.]|nr:hypothetical protein [Rhodoglobus sp.]
TVRWKDWIVRGGWVRFYVGYPIEAPNGQRIGTLCVVDSRPRRFTPAEHSLLRELAGQVQTVLWGRSNIDAAP